MSNYFFEVLRSGINTTFQDKGRFHMQHFGVTPGGCMDQDSFSIANALVGNHLDEGVLEFAYQGPLLKLKFGKVSFAIAGNVKFNVIRKNSSIEQGVCYKTFNLYQDDQIDIISTHKSVYGYLSIQKGFKGDYFWGSCSTNTKSEIGSNNGKKFSVNERIYLNQAENDFCSNKINYINSKIEFIRVIKGTNFDYFFEIRHGSLAHPATDLLFPCLIWKRTSCAR